MLKFGFKDKDLFKLIVGNNYNNSNNISYCYKRLFSIYVYIDKMKKRTRTRGRQRESEAANLRGFFVGPIAKGITPRGDD
jgi:hypothetical protein